MPDTATKEYSIPVLEGRSFTFARAYFTEKEYFVPVEKDMEHFLMYLKILTRVKEINLL